METLISGTDLKIAREYKEYGLFTGNSLFEDVPVKEPVIEGLLYERDVICISAQPGIGKSILALQMACNLTTGSDFLDTYRIPKPRNVLLVQTEGDRTETVERLRNMMEGVPLDASRLFHYNIPGLEINDTAGMNEFLRDIYSGVDYEVIILDPLYTTVKGTLVSDETATHWFREVRRLRIHYPKASLIIMHHDGKAVVIDGKVVERSDLDIFGSNFWSAIFSNNFKLKYVDKSRRLYALNLGKMRSGPDRVASEIRMKMLHPMPLMYVIDEEQLTDTTAKVESILKNNSDRAYRRCELEELVERSKPTVWRALKVLIDVSKVGRIQNGNLVMYRWLPSIIPEQELSGG